MKFNKNKFNNEEQVVDFAEKTKREKYKKIYFTFTLCLDELIDNYI